MDALHQGREVSPHGSIPIIRRKGSVKMGMYDKTPNFGEVFKPGDRFVVMGAQFIGQISTWFGDASKSIFTLITREHPDRRVQYAVLGEGFARQAQNATPSDFPHVAEYVTVPTGKQGQSNVKLLAPVAMDPRAFIDGDDGPPAVPMVDPLSPTPLASQNIDETEDIPF